MIFLSRYYNFFVWCRNLWWFIYVFIIVGLWIHNILLHAMTRAFYRPVEINEKNPSLHSNPWYTMFECSSLFWKEEEKNATILKWEKILEKIAIKKSRENSYTFVCDLSFVLHVCIRLPFKCVIMVNEIDQTSLISCCHQIIGLSLDDGNLWQHVKIASFK